MEAGQSSDDHANAREGEGEIVEIKIKTLDAQSYTLRVHKNTPVPALKDQIATVVGVPVENQRLICRGKVLKDDQILAAYNVEDGHTLHLVARQPPQPSPPSSTSGQDQAQGPSDMVIVSPRGRPGHVSHSLLMGTINIPDSGEGGIPDLNRIISAVLNSMGIGNAIPGAAGAGSGGSAAVGAQPSASQQAPGSDVQPRAEGADARLHGGTPRDRTDSIDDIESQLQLDAIYGVPSPGILNGPGANITPSPFRIIHQQPVVVPDALTTMSQYLDRLEQTFPVTESGRGQNVGLSASDSAMQPRGSTGPGQTSESLLGRAVSNVAPSSSSGPAISSFNPVNDRQGTGVSTGPPISASRLPTPSALGIIVNRVQELLSGQAGTALSRLAAQLENEPNLVDSLTREDMQRTALRDGNMMQQLGALLLELGRATLTLRLGQSPAESIVNAGPAVFISPSGPNPMMVQSLPLQTGVAVGALPSGTPQANGGVLGPSLGPRSINIHIHTSDLRLPSPTPSPPQPPPGTVIGVSSGAPALTVRQRIERAEAVNPEHTLTVRQIIERAEASNGGQSGPGELNPQVASGGAVQGAIMTFTENGAMRVVPVRSRTTTGPLAGHTHVMNEGDAMFQPLLARFQQQLGSVQNGRPSLVVSSNSPPVNSTGGATATMDHPPGTSAPSLRAQVHIQAWRPSLMQALAGGSSQPAAGGSSQPVAGGSAQSGPNATQINETQTQSVTPAGSQIGGNVNNRDPTQRADSHRAADSFAIEQSGEGLVPGVDVSQIVSTLGPFLNQLQLAVAIQQGRTQPTDQPVASQISAESGMSNSSLSTAVGNLQGGNVFPVQSGHAPSTILSGNSQPGPEAEKDDKMDVGNTNESAIDVRDGPGSTSSILPTNEKSLEEKSPQQDRSIEEQVGKEKSPGTPIGLGLGGLQPLPDRSRRRTQAQPRQTQAHLRQTQAADVVGAPAAASNGLPTAQTSLDQTTTSSAEQDLLQNLMPSMDRGRHRVEGMEQSLGQLRQGLLPLIGNFGNRGSAQGAEGGGQLGDIISQLMSRPADGSSGQGPFPADMLRGMMGQLVQSPIMENLMQQVMTGVQNEEAEVTENSALGNNSRNQGVQAGQGGFDFAGIVQQMLPVVSQMFGARPTPSVGQQVPSSTNIRNFSEEGAPRDSPGLPNDSGRWREALSEEEAMSWGETISADVEQQQLMEPQRPFSDIYVRGSPLAKRQKTDVEGVTQVHENEGVTDDSAAGVPQTAGELVGGSNASTNGVEGARSGLAAGTDGANDAYMAVLFHDLAARVAADPDFGDGSELSNAT